VTTTPTTPTPPPLHELLLPLAPLLGTWEGHGQGEYPTIEPFEYREQVTFTHGGKPFLVYAQRTWALDDGRPLHVETGYWRVPAPGRLEVVLSHPTGVTEIAEGTFTVGDGELDLELVSTAVGLTSTAKEVTALGRSLRVDLSTDDEPDVLQYTLRMAAVGRPLTHHLAASLRRTAAL
jgi:hypothetical protein